VIEAQDVPFM